MAVSALTAAIVAFAAGIGLWMSAFWLRRRRNAVVRAPHRRARELAPGPAEIEGTAVKLDEHVVAPISGEPCLHWRYELEELETRIVVRHIKKEEFRETEEYWNVLRQGQDRCTFGVDDGTAIAHVDPRGAELPGTLVADYTNAGGAVPPILATFLERNDIGLSRGIAKPRIFRLREYRLDPGAHIVVQGTAVVRHGETQPILQRDGAVPFLATETRQRDPRPTMTAAMWLCMTLGAAFEFAGAWLVAVAAAI